MAELSYTYEQAREHLYATFWQKWIDETTGVRSVIPDCNPLDEDAAKLCPVLWEEEEPEDLSDVTVPTVYVYVRHHNSKRTAISDRMFTRYGFVLARVIVPTDAGLKTGDQLAYVVKSAFEGKRGYGDGRGIWFKSVRVTEAGAQQGRYLFLVTADFEYEEITGA